MVSLPCPVPLVTSGGAACCCSGDINGYSDTPSLSVDTWHPSSDVTIVRNVTLLRKDKFF